TKLPYFFAQFWLMNLADLIAYRFHTKYFHIGKQGGNSIPEVAACRTPIVPVIQTGTLEIKYRLMMPDVDLYGCRAACLTHQTSSTVVPEVYIPFCTNAEIPLA